MSKRSALEKIVYYNRKIRKLESKENKRRLQAIQTPIQDTSSDENEEILYEDETRWQEQAAPPDPLTLSHDQIEIHEISELESVPPVSGPELVLTDVAPEAPATITNDPAQEKLSISDLDPEILSALGEATDDVPQYGPKIHPNLAERWQPLLRKGLIKDVKEKLLREYLIPENCPLLQAPKLNSEISAAITDMARNRDKKLETAQQQLGLAISAINTALTLLLNGEDKIPAIRHFSNGCRILTDLHFTESQTRTKLITPGLAKSFLNVIQDSERDETLFGNKLPEKIKASKAIEKQGLQIKKPITNTKILQSSSATTSTAHRANYQYQGNWQGPSRYPSNRGGRGGQRKPPMMGAARKPPQPQTRPAGQSKARAAAQQ